MQIIYTNHAEARIRLRKLSKTSIAATIADPDHSKLLGDGKRKFIKLQGKRLYHVVAKYLYDQRAWLVISVWVRGEDDPPNWLWVVITAPFRFIWWLVKLLFGWS